MNLTDARNYLKENGETLLAGGMSGAKVCDIAGKYVLKYVRRAELKNDELYNTYRREASWYETTMGKGTGFRLLFLPEILDICDTDEEIAVLMKRYQAVPRENIDENLLKKVMKTLAAVHTTEIPGVLKKGRQENSGLKDKEQKGNSGFGDKGQQGCFDAEHQERQGNSGLGDQEQQGYFGSEHEKPQKYSDAEYQQTHLYTGEEIKTFLAGWHSVLAEHPGVFDEAPLVKIAEKINDIILWSSREKAVLNHGDFHWGNLLQDAQGNLLVCDWQGVSAGAASGDLSFLFSRLGADGIHLDEKQAVHFYAQEIGRLCGKTPCEEEIFRRMDAADVITSFVFWHQYLHGNDVERVRGIYGKMVEKAAGV